MLNRHLGRQLKLLLLTTTCVVALGCTSTVGTITLTLIQSPETSEDPLEGIADFVRVRVDGPDGRVGPVIFSQASGSGILEDIPTGPDQVITVEGVGPEGNAVSRGQTAPMTIQSGENTLELFIGRINHFSRTPTSKNDSPRGGLITARAFHSATPLAGGQVLLVGGVSEGQWRPGGTSAPPKALSQVELVDTTSLRFAKIDCKERGRCPTFPRVGHSATALPSGNVLIVGGISASTSPPRPVEVFTATTKRFLTGADLGTPRTRHAATRQGDAIAIVGGSPDGKKQVTRSVERYENGTLREQPQLQEPRRDFALLQLHDGSLFVSGGFDAQGRPLASTELLSSGAARWAPGPPLKVARGFHSATLLPSGGVIIIGGLDATGQAIATIERLSSDHKTTRAVGKLHLARWGHTTTRLRDGRIIVAGGFSLGIAGSPTRTVEEITVVSDTLINVKEPFSLHEERAGHTASLLSSGWLLITGGVSIHCDASQPPICAEAPSSTAEVFVY